VFGETTVKLKNWLECGFDFQIEIGFDDEMPRNKFIVNHQCAWYGATYHKSLNAAKSFIRGEYASCNTPRFKWVNANTAEVPK